jgi:hypothetical protein
MKRGGTIKRSDGLMRTRIKIFTFIFLFLILLFAWATFTHQEEVLRTILQGGAWFVFGLLLAEL